MRSMSSEDSWRNVWSLAEKNAKLTRITTALMMREFFSDGSRNIRRTTLRGSVISVFRRPTIWVSAVSGSKNTSESIPAAQRGENNSGVRSSSVIPGDLQEKRKRNKGRSEENRIQSQSFSLTDQWKTPSVITAEEFSFSSSLLSPGLWVVTIPENFWKIFVDFGIGARYYNWAFGKSWACSSGG